MKKIMKIHPQNTKKYTLKIVLLSLAVSLSGCAGSGLGTWNNNLNSNWSNITGSVRNYGKYPTPNAVTCFINPTTVNAQQRGLFELTTMEAREGNGPITLVKDYLIPATNQLFAQNNPKPLNALYAQIQPQTLANFMIGCNEVIVQEAKTINKETKTINKETKTLNKERITLNKEILDWQHYLNTTPAPQPTLQTFQASYIYAHPEIEKAMEAFANIYEGKPLLLFLTLSLYTPVDQVNNLYNINTIQGLQQQLQQRHLMTSAIPPEQLKLLPPINWAQYKITFGSVLMGALERVADPFLINSSMTKLEQRLQQLHQRLQQLHQRLQQLHQRLQQLHQTHLVAAEFKSPQAILNTFESMLNHGGPGALGVINYEKAVIASQNGNFSPLIAIYSQAQPQTWRNYFVNYYKMTQQYHNKVKVDMTK